MAFWAVGWGPVWPASPGRTKNGVHGVEIERERMGGIWVMAGLHGASQEYAAGRSGISQVCWAMVAGNRGGWRRMTADGCSGRCKLVGASWSPCRDPAGRLWLVQWVGDAYG